MGCYIENGVMICDGDDGYDSSKDPSYISPDGVSGGSDIGFGEPVEKDWTVAQTLLDMGLDPKYVDKNGTINWTAAMPALGALGMDVTKGAAGVLGHLQTLFPDLKPSTDTSSTEQRNYYQAQADNIPIKQGSEEDQFAGKQALSSADKLVDFESEAAKRRMLVGRKSLLDPTRELMSQADYDSWYAANEGPLAEYKRQMERRGISDYGVTPTADAVRPTPTTPVVDPVTDTSPNTDPVVDTGPAGGLGSVIGSAAGENPEVVTVNGLSANDFYNPNTNDPNLPTYMFNNLDAGTIGSNNGYDGNENPGGVYMFNNPDAGTIGTNPNPYGPGEDGYQSYQDNLDRTTAQNVSPLQQAAAPTDFSLAMPYPAGTGSGSPMKQMLRAKGGSIKGGLSQASEAKFFRGKTKGQADKIPAMLSDGEFVFDADTVAAMGDGNTEAGASALEQMRQNIRKHKRSAPANKIPPKAKKPEAYLPKKGK